MARVLWAESVEQLRLERHGHGFLMPSGRVCVSQGALARCALSRPVCSGRGADERSPAKSDRVGWSIFAARAS